MMNSHRLYLRRSNLSISSPLRTLGLQQRHSHIRSHGSASAERPEGTDREKTQMPSLGILPLSMVLRSWAIMSLSSSSSFMSLASKMLKWSIKAPTLFNIERNFVLRWLVKKTFYNQFCLGEARQEVALGLQQLKQRVGYHSIMLEYAAEVLEDDAKQTPEALQMTTSKWRHDLLETIALVDAGDFVALKWSGMGAGALKLLIDKQPPSPQMEAAMHDVCRAATAKKVALLPASEPQVAQAGVDDWTLRMARVYNRNGPVVYNTYQCYLKSTPATLSRHLLQAQAERFSLGVKMVRGAYLATERRDLIWATKAQTDECYDQLIFRILGTRDTALILATHNVESLRKSQAIQNKHGIPLVFAQLHGMALDISCQLLRESTTLMMQKQQGAAVTVYATWGRVSDCLGYLLRRADENKEAMARTIDTRRAMASELLRRLQFPRSWLS